MPVYVYECDKCGGRFEYTQSIKDAPRTECETCGGKLTKVIVPTAFVLKGGGWYKDLYGRPKPAEAKPETKGDASTSTSTPSEKPETKAEPKPEATKKDKPE